jgi:hypothetical protein
MKHFNHVQALRSFQKVCSILDSFLIQTESQNLIASPDSYLHLATACAVRRF